MHLLCCLAVTWGTPLFHTSAQTPDLIPRFESMTLGRGTVETFDWRPDGSVIAVGGSRGIWLYAPNFQLLAQIDTASVKFLHWTGATQLTSVTATGQTFMWTIADGTFEAIYQEIPTVVVEADNLSFNGHPVTQQARFADAYLALGTASGEIGLVPGDWQPSALQAYPVLTGHTAPINDLAWSADGSILASVSGFNFQGSELRLWDIATYQPMSVLPGTAALTQVQFQPGTGYVTIAGEDNLVRTLDPLTGQVIAVAQGHTDVIEALDWKPDGTEIASASDDGIIRVWDVASGEAVASFAGHTRGTNAVAWSPDGQMIASAGWDNAVRVWMRSTGKERAHMVGHVDRVWSVAWSPDGLTLASASRDATVRTWQPYTGALQRTFDTRNEEMNVVIWRADGSQLAAGGDNGSVLVWDHASGDIQHILVGHNRYVWALAWHGDQIISSSWWDGTIRLWDVERDTYVDSLNTIDVLTIAWSPGGDYLVTGHSGGTMRVWTVENNRVEVVTQAHRGDIFALDWRPDGSQLATGGADGVIRLWNP